jgi:hypothetical protein
MADPKNFRINADIREKFEKRCSDRILHETGVIEALILNWLKMNETEWSRVAEDYSAWLHDQKAPPTPKLAAKHDPTRGKKLPE